MRLHTPQAGPLRTAIERGWLLVIRLAARAEGGPPIDLIELLAAVPADGIEAATLQTAVWRLRARAARLEYLGWELPARWLEDLACLERHVSERVGYFGTIDQ